MSSRVFVNPQAGRHGKTGVKKEEEWGTTTSQSEFRGYEPAEMRNARDGPRHTRGLTANLQPASDRGTQPKYKKSELYAWNRLQEQFPDHSAYTVASDGTLPKLSEGSKRPTAEWAASKAEQPAWATTHMNPIPEKKFDATSSYSQHQLQAQQARHGHFPYRDEFAPRSKRLLYELAHARVSKDSVASGSTATASAFTMSSQRSAARSGAARSQSEGSLASSHHTCDTDRLFLHGGVAKRRAQAQFRSPALCPRDEEWFRERWDRDGPAGLTFHNFKPGFYQRSAKMDVEQTIAIKPLLGGHKEDELVGR